MAKTSIVEKKMQDDLKAKRNVLFEQFVRNPKQIHLALEIKAIDDQIAKLRLRTANGTRVASEPPAR